MFLWADPAENIDPDNDNSQFAWGENAGWANFEPTHGGGVEVADAGLTGYVWHENVGWIKLDYDGTPGATNTDETNWGVTNDGGNLGGYAWGENVGWINFNPTHSQVTIDSSGNFSGYAWSENCGWIKFAGTATGGTAYKVKRGWSPGGGDTGIDHHWSWYNPGHVCAIATASYGTPMAEEVRALSRFRDQYLLTNRPGQELVRFYYRHSPPIADFIRNKEPLKAVVRAGLKPLVWLAEKITR